MATRAKESSEEEIELPSPYDKIEQIVMERVFSLEAENTQLKSELSYVKAKLEVYEKITSISDSKISLGFGTFINKEGGM